MDGQYDIRVGDCLDLMRAMPAASVDLVFCSPPYDAARTYGIGFKSEGDAWAEWAKPRFRECLRVSKGLVAWVVDGQTRDFAYSCSPFLLMADLHREGVKFRHPAVYKRIGIPGSGGAEWLRNDWEPIICATREGRLPWADNTAMGHPLRWAPGGAMSNRLSTGARVNQWGHSIDSGATVVDEGGVVRSKGKRPSHVEADPWGKRGRGNHLGGREANGAKNKGTNAQPWGDGGAMPAGKKNGDVVRDRKYARNKRLADGSVEDQQFEAPAIANPGNYIDCSDCVECIVGGGVMGDDFAHENEAPFPERLAEFFVKSFCPPGGTVLDCFGGSGTTGKVAVQNGRNAILMDIRPQMGALIERRIRTALSPQTYRDESRIEPAPLFTGGAQ